MKIEEAIKSKYQIDRDQIAFAGDGGTISFELIDADNERHTIFIDRRMDSTTKNHLYANHYPGDKNSIYLGVDKNILEELERIK